MSYVRSYIDVVTTDISYQAHATGLTNPKADFITGQKNMLMRVPLETRFKEWETR